MTTFLENELAWLDLLLHREILRLRTRYQLSLDEFRGLYISDQQVDDLLQEEASVDRHETSLESLSEQARRLRVQNRERLDAQSPWFRLCEILGLSALEENLLLLVLAPELDPKYETLYAYLNNDVSRKRPTHDLALRLFCETDEARLEMRRVLLPRERLYSRGVLLPNTFNEAPSAWLGLGISISPVVCDFLLGMPPGGRMPSYAGFHAHDRQQTYEALPGALRRLPTMLRAKHTDPMPWLVFNGRNGSGRNAAAAAVAGALGKPLIRVDLQAAIRDGGFSQALQAILLWQCLTDALLCFAGLEHLFDQTGTPLAEATGPIARLQETDSLLCFTGDEATSWRKLLPWDRVLAFNLDEPAEKYREMLWNRQIQQTGLVAASDNVTAVAERFALTPGQIGEAVRWVSQMHCLRGGNGDARLSESLLFEAARTCSSGHFGRLAVKVEHRYGWRDLVLPPAVMQQVEEVASAIRHRRRVYVEWGMAQRFDGAGGLKVLFSGASGTGKTMTASVLAGDLGLDLFRIDLSGIVSKYIGETEKNLDEIFRTARATNAILFFDEADALFGKRSEVKDAHDRYANIEVAYLLQKMEEYDGVVILASNLSKNIDQAFSRRMHYVVEFPLPDETLRERLWQGMLPADLPLEEGVDLAFLARQFRFAGGDIKNIVLSAAFLAAPGDGGITMETLLQATARQMIKQGNMPSANEFKHYYRLVARPH